MKAKNKILLIISLLLIPTIVFASDGSNDFPIGVALGMEAFVSIHMSFIVLLPLAEIISQENKKKTFWILFGIRAGILLFFDFFITPMIALVDFFAVFIGAFIVVPISLVVSGKKNKSIGTTPVISQPGNTQVAGVELKCAKCSTVVQVSDKFCPKCGLEMIDNNIVVSENKNAAVAVPQKKAVLPSNFDSIYSLSENKMLEEFINREFTKVGIDKNSKLIPSDILRRKKILNTIFSVLVFIFISMIFFHFPISTYVLGLIILIIFFIVTRKYNLMKYIIKQLKARPSEKISNIVMNVKNNFVSDSSFPIFVLTLVISIVCPIFIFSSPRIIYEKVDGGYGVRYYLYGLSNYRTAEIPSTYKGENIVTLRGNTFSNMFYLESVKLPDTITEIRGQAFKNCTKLTEVNIPEKLQYLGGGAFYNAKSIKRIEFPDTVTYIGGESFYGASSLEYVKLSENLKEIRGDSFEYCTSLKSIKIPDRVTRIGGHAFYGDTSLSEVTIGPNSKLSEIGSSAFRQCYSLQNITIPADTYVNERAFKESPTTVNRYGSVNNNFNY